jgi:hypothetical protein
MRASLRAGNAAALVPGFGRERASCCALIDQRFAEGLCEARRDRPQAFAPMRQREREFVRKRCRNPANAVRKLTEIASRERPIFQEVEQERIHVCADRLHGIERERIAIALIGMQDRLAPRRASRSEAIVSAFVRGRVRGSESAGRAKKRRSNAPCAMHRNAHSTLSARLNRVDSSQNREVVRRGTHE